MDKIEANAANTSAIVIKILKLSNSLNNLFIAPLKSFAFSPVPP